MAAMSRLLSQEFGDYACVMVCPVSDFADSKTIPAMERRSACPQHDKQAQPWGYHTLVVTKEEGFKDECLPRHHL